MESMEAPHEAGLAHIGDEDDNASDTPDIMELHEIEHFTAVLQHAQRLAVEAERARGCTQVTHPPGKSGRMMRRCRRAQKMLAVTLASLCLPSSFSFTLSLT